MALHTENMNEVKSGQELIPEGWYHIRVAKVEETTSSTGGPVVKMNLKIQDEAFIGRIIPVMASLQAQALFTLKAFYEACEYHPGPEGHDPEQLLDRECFVKVTHKMLEGEQRTDVKAHHIKPLREGRPQK